MIVLKAKRAFLHVLFLIAVLLCAETVGPVRASAESLYDKCYNIFYKLNQDFAEYKINSEKNYKELQKSVEKLDISDKQKIELLLSFKESGKTTEELFSAVAYNRIVRCLDGKEGADPKLVDELKKDMEERWKFLGQGKQ